MNYWEYVWCYGVDMDIEMFWCIFFVCVFGVDIKILKVVDVVFVGVDDEILVVIVVYWS